jgi:Zn-dependent peptidase ImmA (M78 family)/DNA-binding XRE family transcriptional regulator
MAHLKAIVKHDLLVWGRDSAGFNVEEAAKKLGVKPNRLVQWEEGRKRPTIIQLRRLAQVYKRPLSVFYLQEVPRRFQVLKDFRRLPGEVAGRYSPSLTFETRSAQQRRELAIELARALGEETHAFKLKATLADNPEVLGLEVRKALNVGYAEQARWRDPRKGFNTWRDMIEEFGVLVFQTTGPARTEIGGFSIAERIYPVIAVNRRDALNGRTFSLVHEFAHLMLRRGGLCDFDEDAPRPPEEQTVEVFCNRVAGATLVPRDHILNEDIVEAHGTRPTAWTDSEISELSKRYSVSEEVILRRLLTFDRMTQKFYQVKRAEFLQLYEQLRKREKEKAKEQEFRRNPPREAVSNFGKPFIRLLLNTYYQDLISLSDVSGYLGVRLRHLPKIEKAVVAV